MLYNCSSHGMPKHTAPATDVRVRVWWHFEVFFAARHTRNWERAHTHTHTDSHRTHGFHQNQRVRYCMLCDAYFITYVRRAQSSVSTVVFIPLTWQDEAGISTDRHFDDNRDIVVTNRTRVFLMLNSVRTKRLRTRFLSNAFRCSGWKSPIVRDGSTKEKRNFEWLKDLDIRLDYLIQ